MSRFTPYANITNDYGYKNGNPDRDEQRNLPVSNSDLNVMRSVLDEARSIVCGPRNSYYGNPNDNHARTAELWVVYLRHLNGRTVDARDVAALNILQKLARDLHRRKRDNMVDIAGWAANAEACCPEPPPNTEAYDYDNPEGCKAAVNGA